MLGSHTLIQTHACTHTHTAHEIHKHRPPSVIQFEVGEQSLWTELITVGALLNVT